MAKFNEYPAKTTPKDADKFMLYSVEDTANKLIDYDKLADAVLNKLTSKQFTLDQGTKTILAALNELNSKRLTGSIKPGETKEITFGENYGCLIFFYHPYFGVGLYGICAFGAENTASATTILKQANNTISFSTSNRTIKITSEKNTDFCIFASRFYG